MRIRHKLLLSVLSAVLVAFVTLAYLSYASSRKALIKQIENNARSTLNANIEKLNGELDSLQTIAQDIGLAIETMRPTSEDDIDALIKIFLDKNRDAYGSTVSFVPGTFGQKELFGPYYHRSRDGLQYVDLSNPSYNYPQWDWFKIPLSTKEPVWMEPYIDTGGGNVAMTTYSYPFFKDDSVWGVATVDVSLPDLTDIVKRIEIGKTGFAFLISREGKFLSMRQKEWEISRTIFDAAKEFGKPELDTLGQDMVSGKTGFVSMINPLDSKPAWFVYGPIPLTGWSLAIAYPERELMSDLSFLHHKIALISIVGIIVVFIIIFFISKKISNPLIVLASGAKKIAGGSLNVELNEVTTKDEVGDLTRAFRDMKYSLLDTLGQLRKEKEMFQIAFSQMTNGLVILNVNWRVLQSNRVADNLLMLPATKPLIEHLQEHYENSIPWPKLVNLNDKKCSFELIRHETDNLLKLLLRCDIIPIFNAERKLIERVLSISDVTAQLAEDDSKRNFLSLISHKLLTPITVLQGKLMLLKDGLLGKLDEKQQLSVDSMAAQTSKLRSLIESLVNFVTLEGAAIDMSKEDIELNSFFDEVTKDAEVKHLDKKSHITVLVSNGASKVSFNRKYLRLIVGELIENGIKFNMSPNAVISVEAKKVDSLLVISVNDNGIGIPPEFLDKLYDKFFQIDKYFTGNVEGVGLGLAYVRKIVEAFEGSITATSLPGKGSTFTVQLPV